MKKNKLNFFFYTTMLIVPIIFLVGCTDMNGTADMSNTQQGLAGGQNQITNQDKEVQNLPTTQQVQLSEADQAAYQGALELNDVSYCNKITDEDYQKKCQNDVNDQIALQNAKTQMNPDLCKTLSTQDKQNACKIEVQTAIDLSQQVEIETHPHQYSQMDQAYYSRAIDQQDSTYCDKITDSNYKSACKSAIK